MKAPAKPIEWVFVRALLLLLVCSVVSAFAQLYTGSLTGTVLDPSGAPVGAAKVALDDVDRGIRSLTTTDSSGRYVFPLLPPRTVFAASGGARVRAVATSEYRN